jgi:hypothetical protein
MLLRPFSDTTARAQFTESGSSGMFFTSQSKLCDCFPHFLNIDLIDYRSTAFCFYRKNVYDNFCAKFSCLQFHSRTLLRFASQASVPTVSVWRPTLISLGRAVLMCFSYSFHKSLCIFMHFSTVWAHWAIPIVSFSSLLELYTYRQGHFLWRNAPKRRSGTFFHALV